MAWGFDDTDHAAAKKAETAADKRREAEAQEAMEYAKAWRDANSYAAAVLAGHKEAARRAGMPPPTDSENLLALREHFERQELRDARAERDNALAELKKEDDK